MFCCYFSHHHHLLRIGLGQTRLPRFVSIVPQQYFVQQIGKDKVDVAVMVQPGAASATYEPKTRTDGQTIQNPPLFLHWRPL